MSERQAVLFALDALSDETFLLAMSAAQGVIHSIAMCLEDDPSADVAAVEAIEAFLKARHARV